VLLGFDGLVTAADGAIGAVDRDSAVVVSTTRTPTGRMVSHPDIGYPDAEIGERLRSAVGGGRVVDLDASRLCESLVGTAAPANILLLGVALQSGLIPVSVDSVERAIDLNGVAVDANLAALDWGRRWAHDPETVERLAADATTGERGRLAPPTVEVPDLPNRLRSRISALGLDTDAQALVELLAADLLAYQDLGYARSFVDSVAEAAEAEWMATDQIGPLTAAVARNLHKLMAYKDEYEVARLMLGPEGQAAAHRVGGPEAEVTWHLHPPMLKALGLDSKINLGPWATPALKALRAGKRLRGTRFDPFGRMEMRRIERSLIDEYRSAMATVYHSLTASNVDEAVAVARLPDMVRGYEALKLRRVAEFRSALAHSLEAFHNP
jgi:indolepyruvate ferredoxin oxidoreductase